MFLAQLKQWAGQKHSDLKASIANWLVRREVIRVLRLTHANELSGTPRNEWPLVKSHQAQEIQAVAAGQMDIIDRRSWAFPYLPEALHRLNQPVLKSTPYNLRRFSETPIPRRAINLIKNALLMFEWAVEPEDDIDEQDPDVEQRVRIVTEGLKRPNNIDSWREFAEAVIEDIICGGYGCIEHRVTPYYKRPVKMWAVDGSTIRIFLDWTESTPDRPRFAQMTGLKGERGIVTFLDSELVYIRDNVRTSTPFGMGNLEVAFTTINSFLGVQDMAGKAGSDQVHKTWLWWEQTMNPGHIQTVRRQIMNELEGQSKVSLMAGAKKPEALEITPVTPEDLLLDWQKFLIGIIANAFDLSPMALGETDKVNKATGQVMAETDFRSSVLPKAKRFEEAMTRHIIHGAYGWKDLRFRYIGLEDPDAITRTTIQQKQYMMNAITPDEVREAMNLPAIEGGWGRLTMGQAQILMLKAQAALGVGKGAGGGSSSGGGAGAGTGTGGGGASAMGMGGNGIGGSMFSAGDVADMDPSTIQLYQELGILPPGAQLPQEMEQQEPGILQQLSSELQTFFEFLEQEDEASEIQPRLITRQDEAGQMEKFDEQSHVESLAEKTINRRGMFGPGINQQYRKNPERGKYPRSGGRFIDPNIERVQGDDVVSPRPTGGGGFRKAKMAKLPGGVVDPKETAKRQKKSHYQSKASRKKQPYQ